MLRVVDVGTRFGMDVVQIFAPWEIDVLTPTDLAETRDIIKELKPDLVCLGGGQDVNPAVYGHMNNGSRVWGSTINGRDLYEIMVYKACREASIPILGICRGAQILCALNGGKLIQHVDGHTTGHQMTTDDGRELYTTSLHHQMMHPGKIPHEMIAWATQPLSQFYEWGGTRNEGYPHVEKEPEIIFYPKTKCLCVQGHPEFMNPDHPTVEYVRSLVSSKLNVNPKVSHA